MFSKKPAASPSLQETHCHVQLVPSCTVETEGRVAGSRQEIFPEQTNMMNSISLSRNTTTQNPANKMLI